jgi:hypothetical protein
MTASLVFRSESQLTLESLPAGSPPKALGQQFSREAASPVYAPAARPGIRFRVNNQESGVRVRSQKEGWPCLPDS